MEAYLPHLILQSMDLDAARALAAARAAVTANDGTSVDGTGSMGED